MGQTLTGRPVPRDPRALERASENKGKKYASRDHFHANSKRPQFLPSSRGHCVFIDSSKVPERDIFSSASLPAPARSAPARAPACARHPMPELPAGQRRARAAQWPARCVPLVRQGAGPNPRTNGPGPGPGSLSKLHWGEDSCVFTASREVKMRGIATRRGRTRTRPSTASKCRSGTLGIACCSTHSATKNAIVLYCKKNLAQVGSAGSWFPARCAFAAPRTSRRPPGSLSRSSRPRHACCSTHSATKRMLLYCIVKKSRPKCWLAARGRTRTGPPAPGRRPVGPRA